MKNHYVYQGTLEVCQIHADRLSWAMNELKPSMPISPDELENLSPLKLAIFDQFVVRFSKLQDAMGARLLPAVLELTQEQGDLNAFIDKLNRLEKVGAIESVDEWLELREMRNQFAHDYPQDAEIQASLLNRAFVLSERILTILHQVNLFAERYLKPNPTR